jgi:hypothetical protein
VGNLDAKLGVALRTFYNGRDEYFYINYNRSISDVD